MGLLERIKRHSAVTSGDFSRMFPGLDDLPPLPTAVSGLFRELNSSEPDVGRLMAMTGHVPGLAVRMLRVVNAPLFGLQNRVADIHQAVVLLGFRRVRQIAITYVMMDSLPVSKDSHLDFERFWIGSLVTATTARELARITNPGQEEGAFTAGLLADVAMPVLATSWAEYYEPVLESWLNGGESLEAVERQIFNWDHGQAGAWILGSWGFPDQEVCFAAAHTLTPRELEELGLDDSLAMPIALAALVPSALKPGQVPVDYQDYLDRLGVSAARLGELMTRVKDEVTELLALFGLPSASLDQIFSSFSTISTSAEVET